MVKVMLDPGHGGTDPGGVANGLQEKNLTLKIAIYTRDYLLANYRGIVVRMTRSDDRFISLNSRSQQANAFKANLFVSIQINSGGGTGFETYRFTGRASSTTLALQSNLHSEILTAMKSFGNVGDRGQKQANYAVLRQTTMPANLTENLFIDRTADANLLKNETFLKAVGEAHARAIAKTLGVAPISQPKPTPAPEQPGENEGGRTLNLQEWQWKELAEVYAKANQSGVLKSDQWTKKAQNKTLTVDEAIFLNAILIGR
ncbi:N-acetylmuramoyl-L-alanine amidase [Priestia filamentosa]|uniref:N-acetylmuramoyl-L-alanine amidase n=1 Tax=Priestia filamentosa TaxID=1402861 RepID=UPI0028949BA6|nr:N-acetylmuramoyl-L-alanine amidase [Priestia filamentosa]MDT3763623.1 N-acetylmuramoyl-L-alanine amidase [Priestia filamentosa]